VPDATAEAALASLLEARTARIVVLGQGYVGLPLAARLAGTGFSVAGLDGDSERCRRVAAGEPVLGEGSERLAAELAELSARERYAIHEARPGSAAGGPLASCDVALVCVPTPLAPDRTPDLGHVRAAGFELGAHLADDTLVVLESTTYPGTTRGVFRDAIEAGRRATGRPPARLFLAYSPEREDPGRDPEEQRRVPKLVGGTCPASERLSVALYRSAFADVVPCESAEVAEAAKLFENVFRAVNIALVNEAKTVLDAMDIDVWRVLDAAATKPFGFMPFQPGPGMGGHCIPIDPFYFAWAGEQHGVRARFVELAGEVNRAMPSWVTQRLEAALEERGRALRGAHVLVLGLAYKRDVADLRESPALDLVDRLLFAGAQVTAVDPHVQGATTPGGAELETVALDAEQLEAADAVLVVTDHTAFDYPLIAERAGLVVDTRGILRAFASTMGARLVRA
jgi:UDP-N-acetyl-D-glucosamine dehydrogenase